MSAQQKFEARALSDERIRVVARGGALIATAADYAERAANTLLGCGDALLVAAALRALNELEDARGRVADIVSGRVVFVKSRKRKGVSS